MAKSPSPIFLERRTYRRRRMMDAAYLLPLLGLLLFLVPLLLAPETDAQPATGRNVIYIFTVWAGLIVITGWLSRRLARSDTEIGVSDQKK